MDHENIRKLAKLMEELDLTCLEVAEGNTSVRIERRGSPAAQSYGCEPSSAAAHQEPPSDVHTIPSPMVGIFYSSPSPDVKSYVSVGDAVHTGDVLCIIEAMKIMNEITSEYDGIIAEICVGNKQVVEFGHPLFRIRPFAAGEKEGVAVR